MRKVNRWTLIEYLFQNMSFMSKICLSSHQVRELKGLEYRGWSKATSSLRSKHYFPLTTKSDKSNSNKHDECFQCDTKRVLQPQFSLKFTIMDDRKWHIFFHINNTCYQTDIKMFLNNQTVLMLAKNDKNTLIGQINNFFLDRHVSSLRRRHLKLYNNAYVFTKIVFQLKTHTMTHEISRFLFKERQVSMKSYGGKCEV